MSLTNAETAMNGVSLGERSRFQVERVRVADGRVGPFGCRPPRRARRRSSWSSSPWWPPRARRSTSFKPVGTVDELSALLAELGGVAPTGLLGLEVIWTPADANDSMTETDVMTTYPELRSL